MLVFTRTSRIFSSRFYLLTEVSIDFIINYVLFTYRLVFINEKTLLMKTCDEKFNKSNTAHTLVKPLLYHLYRQIYRVHGFVVSSVGGFRHCVRKEALFSAPHDRQPPQLQYIYIYLFLRTGIGSVLGITYQNRY